MSQPLINESERRSLEYFREHASEMAASIRRTGQPIVLMEIDESELVLQDAATLHV